MSIWGKIIGGVAGFALGGPLGALIGAVAGHQVDKMSSASGSASGQGRQMAFTVAVVALSAKMAKADGVVSRAEVEAFKRIFHIPPIEMGNVGRLFDQAKTSADGFEAYAEQAASLFRDSPQVLESLLDALFAIAMADGVLHPAEAEFLRRVATIFGMPDKDFERVRAEAAEPGAGDPYEVLGLTSTASDAEIKAAHRALIKEHHPDLLMA